MKRGIAAALVLLLGAAALYIAFGRPDQPQQTPASPQLNGAADLVAALESAGRQVVWSGQEIHPAIPAPAELLLVDGAELQVFEFNSREERQRVTDDIDNAGNLQNEPLAPWEGQPHVWASGRLLVLYPGVNGATVLLLDGLLGDPLTTQRPAADEPFPPAVSAAVAALSEQLGTAPELVAVRRYESVEWPDSCLGAPAEGEACAQALTPGWLVILQVDDQEYVLRTDSLGTQVRQP